MKRRLGFLLVLLACFAQLPASAALRPDTLAFHPAHVRVSYEQLKLPGNEHMGLMGISYLLEPKPWFYAGLGVYGAVTGKRGGFFIGGLQLGLRRHVSRNWLLDAGLYVGGGGGGAAPQGGGLMLRPHAGVFYKTRWGRIGAGISWVRFPNGGINSKQLALSYELRTYPLYAGGWLRDDGSPPPPGVELKSARRDFMLAAQTYSIPKGTRGRSGLVQDKPMRLLGIQINRYLDNRNYLKIEAAGAGGGGSDGYAQVLFGVGRRFPLSSTNDLRAEIGLGAAGGGNVDTGGGIVANATLSATHRFNNGLLLGANVGYITAPKGDFKATSFGLTLGYAYQVPKLPPPSVGQSSYRSYHPSYWRFRVAHESYFPAAGTRRKGGQIDTRRIDLLGIKVDRMVNDHVYLTGQALGAYRGGAGGYASGLVGAGYILPWWKNSRLALDAEGVVGVGGGGGIDVGSGLVAQATAGLTYRFSEATSVQLSYGYLKSPGGHFSARVFGLSLGYRLTTLER